MSWDQELFALFDDLESQAERAYAVERDLEVAERVAAEYREVTFASRLRASVDREVGVQIRGVGVVEGVLRRVGTDWLLLERDHEWVVRTAAVIGLEGASSRSIPESAWPATARLGFGAMARRIAATGTAVTAYVRDQPVTGCRILRVGADFAELQHGTGRVELIRFEAIVALQRREE